VTVRVLTYSVIAGVLLTAVFAGWLLFVPAGSKVLYILLLPGMAVTAAVLAPVMPVSNSGATNFIILILTGSLLNACVFAALVFACIKVSSVTRRRNRTV